MKKFLITALVGFSLSACATTNPPATPAPDSKQELQKGPDGTPVLHKLTAEEANELGITGTINKEEIRSVIRGHARPIQKCYAQATTRDAKTKGKIVIQWDIADTGKVTNSSVYSNDTSDEKLAQCVRKELAKLTYPKPPKGQTARINYPFAFSPSGELAK